MAWRRRGSPGAAAYWLRSAAMAFCAASLMKAGAGKSGKPWPRFTAPCSTASLVISVKMEVPKPSRRRAGRGRMPLLPRGLDLLRAPDEPEPEAHADHHGDEH